MKLTEFFKLLVMAPLLITGCSKDENGDITPAPGNNNEISAPPATFSQKALLEYHTASWCGSCVDADSKRDLVMDTYPDRVVPVAIHQSDEMQYSGFFTIDATFGSNTADGMVNRKPSLNNVLLNRTQWLTNVTNALSGPPRAGLAILSTVVAGSAAIEVQGAFLNDLPGNYNLTVWLTEKQVSGTGTGYDQTNSYNNDPASRWYQSGNPIAGYKHQYVWRKSVSAVMGDPIPGANLVSGGMVKKLYTVDVSMYNKDNLYVVAFINKVGTTSTTHEVINVQTAKIGTLNNWK